MAHLAGHSSNMAAQQQETAPASPAPQNTGPSIQQPTSPISVQRSMTMPNRPRVTTRGVQYTLSERLASPPVANSTPGVGGSGGGRGGGTRSGTGAGLERSLSRKEQVKRYLRRETASFFGVDESTEEEQQARWLDRRKRLASRRYGRLKDEFDPSLSPPLAGAPLAGDALPSDYLGGGVGADVGGTLGTRPGRPDVLPAPGDEPDGDRVQMRHNAVRRKDSVARLTFNGLSYVVNTLTRHRPRPRSQVRQWSRSFQPEEVSLASSADLSHHQGGTGAPNMEDELFFELPAPAAPPKDSAQDRQRHVSYHEGPSPPSPPDRGGGATPSPAPSSPRGLFPAGVAGRGAETERDRDRAQQRLADSWRRGAPSAAGGAGGASGRPAAGGASRISSASLTGVRDNSDRRRYGAGLLGKVFGRKAVRHSTIERHRAELDDLEDHRPFFTYWVTTVQTLILIISLICYGLGPFGFDLANRSGQVLVPSLSLQQVVYQEPANFWFGPRAADLIHLGAKFGPCMRRDTKILQRIDQGRQQERDTACCIRNDDSGCVQSSKDDCSLRGMRPTTKIISTWKKWSTGDSGPGGRISGSVCGLDPKFCDAPASVAPYEWPDDITQWPICRKTNSFPQQQHHRAGISGSNGGMTRLQTGGRGSSLGVGGGSSKDRLARAEHMVCEVIGHPCCVGIHGACRITTREYCDFVRGYFHEEASLCSQVACLDDVCGMISFYTPGAPDQFYRLWTSLFLHAGVLHLLVTWAVQHLLMRDLEKLCGSLRIAIIYVGSGVAGNLASAIFVPYRAEVGPAGSQFGLLACLIVEVLNAWPMLRRPKLALSKLLAVTLALFIIGLLPWVDNYAHLFGFLFGFLLSYALMPFVSLGRKYERRKKIALIWSCLLAAAILFSGLVVLFYVIPVHDCEICGYFNCLPLTKDMCASQNINFMRDEPVV